MEPKNQNYSKGKGLRMAVSEKDILLRISQITSRILNLEQLLKTSVKISGEAMGVDRCSVWLTDDDKKYAIVKAVYVRGRFDPAHMGARVDIKKFPVFRRIISEGKVIHSPDTSKMAANRSEKKFLAEAKIKSSLSVPLKIKNKVLGAFNVGTLKNYRTFTPSEKRLCQIIANQIAVGIENAILFKKLEDRASHLQEQTIKALRDSEEKYKTLLENLSQLIFLKNKNSVYISANENYCKSLGIKPEEIKGKNDFDFFPKELARKYRKDDREIIRTGRTKEIIEDYIEKGKRKIVQTVKTPVLGDDGKPIGVLGIFWDVTQQKKQENQLILLARLVQNSSDAITASSLDGRFIFWNKGAEKIYGYKAKQIIGKSISTLCPSDIREEQKQIFKKVVRGGEASFESERLTKDGRRVAVHMTVSLLKDDLGKPIAICAIAKDITKRKKAEEALQISQQRYKLSTKAANVGVWDWNIKTNEFFIDPNVKEILGYKDEEIPNDIEVWITYVHPDDREPVMAAAQACLDGKTPQYVFEHRMIHKDGSVRWVLTRGNVIRDTNGNAVRMVGTDTDITQRKKAEEALRDSEEKFRILAENSPNMIFINKKGKVVYANRKCEEVMGYKREEFYAPGFDYLTLIAPEYVDSVRMKFRKHMKGEDVAPYEYAILSKEGKRIEAIASTKLISYQGENAILGMLTDITKRKQMEEMLRDAKEKWVSLTENTNDVIMIVDNKGTLQFLNPTPLAINSKKAIGKTVYEYVPREQHDVLRESLRKVFKTGKSDSYEASPNIPEIGTMWFSTKVVPIKRDRKTVSVILIATDITKRKQMEEELKKFKTISDRAVQGSAIADLKGNLIYINESFAHMHGYTPEELIGKNLSVFHNKEQMKNVKRLNEQLIEAGSYLAQEVWHKRKDGTVFPTLMTATVIKDEKEKPLFLAGTAIDITEHKRADEALKESQRFLDEIIDHIPDPLFIKNRKHQWILLNKALGEMLGYPREEMLGKSDYDFFPKKQADFFWKKDQEMFKTGKIVDVPEEPITDAKGNVHWLHTKKAPLRDSSGKITTLVGIIRDITDRKKAEEALRKSKDLTTILQISYRINQILDLEKMLNVACRETAKALNIERSVVVLLDEKGSEGVIKAIYLKNQPHPLISGARLLLKDFPTLVRLYQQKERFLYAPVVEKAPLSRKEKDYFRKQKIKSFIIVPIDTGTRLLGTLLVGATEKERVFTESEIAFVQTLANHLAIAVENVRLMEVIKKQAENLKILSQRVISAQEEERRKIAQELHDEIGQTLTVMKINMEMSKQRIPSQFTQIIDRIKDNEELVGQTLEKVRDLTTDLRPPLLDDFGLIPTLRWYIESFSKRTNIKVTLKTDHCRSRFPLDLEMVLYRIAQEAMTNVAKHAKATQVSIILEKKNNCALLTVSDDGIGFDSKKILSEQKRKKGFGLFDTKERVKLLNGNFSIISKPKKGTRLQVRIPCPKGR